MRRLLLVLTLTVVLGGLLAGMARAQEPAAVESVEVALWPEYDTPEMLGFYLVRLETETDLPATVTLPLPEDVTEPHIVAAWYPDGRLDDSVEWSLDTQNGHSVVSVTTDTTGVWLEFYAPLEHQGGQRSYTFRWPGGISAREFNFEVMHPVGASGVVVDPAGQVSQDDNSLTFSRLNLGRVAADDTPEISLSYRKPGELPLVWEGPPDPAAPLAVLEVALWPEFDRQETLVIYRAQLPSETQLPATVKLPIPIEVGEPHAVATIGEDRNLYVAEYEMDKVNEWSWISVEANSLLLQIEYYADLRIESDQRYFSYLWPGGVQIDTFQYEIQRPPTAGEVLLTPPGVAQVSQDGLTYIRGALGPKGADEQVAINLGYQKADETFSIDAVVQQPTLERPPDTQGSTPDLTELLPWILGGFGVLIAGVGVFMLLRVRAAGSKASKPRRRRRRKSADEQKLESSPIYCHVCGSQASASDMFCRRCGTKLRN
jgi:hypothetical protein